MSAALPGSFLTGGWRPRAAPFDVGGGASVRSPGGCTLVVAGRLTGMVGEAEGPPALDAVATAFEREGEAMLGRLRGEFVVLAWDPRSRRGVVARDQLGARTLHYAATGTGIVFAEDLMSVRRALPRTPAPDRTTVVDWLATGTVPVGRSWLEGVYRLPPGGLVRLGDDGWSEGRWWRPEFAGVRPGSEEELQRRVLDAMDAAVARSAGGASKVAVMLSGGLDSSTIATALARRGPALAYSGVFPDHEAIQEADLIRELTRALEIPRVEQTVTGGSAVAGAIPYMRRWGVPVGSPNHAVWEPLFERAVEDGVDAMLDGEGGDEVFDVSAYLIADRLRHGRPRGAWSLLHRLTGVPPDAGFGHLRRLMVRHGVKGATPHAAQRLARRLAMRSYTPAWLHPEDARRHRDSYDPWAWKRLSGPLWWRHQAWMITDLRETLDSHGYLRRRSLQTGLADRHPFMHDVDLVDTVLSLPAEPRFDAKYDRVLLRRALAGRLPDSIRLFSGKPRFSALLAGALKGADGELLRGLLADPRAETRSYVRPDVLEREVLGFSAEDHQGSQAAFFAGLWRLGVTELWLRSLGDDAFLDELAERCGPQSAPSFHAAPAGA